MRYGKLTTNWAFEIGTNKLISSDVKYFIHFSIRSKGDHKGIFFSIYCGLIGFECNIYDVRHEDK
jgi:hypothetical protein